MYAVNFFTTLKSGEGGPIYSSFTYEDYQQALAKLYYEFNYACSVDTIKRLTAAIINDDLLICKKDVLVFGGEEE